MPEITSHTPARRIRHRSRRRPLVPIAVALGGVAVLTGLASAAGAVEMPAEASPAFVPVAYTATVSSAESLTAITADAEVTRAAGLSALAAARAVTDDIAASGLDLEVETTIDTAALRAVVDRLGVAEVIPVLLLPAIADEATAATDAVRERVGALRIALDEAIAQKEAEEAAAKAAAEAKRKAEEAAAALAAGNTVAGAKATAERLASEQYGWGSDQFSCLVSLWTKESGWNYQAYNASSGATGIPQSLPGDKMATAGSDWQTNATTQIRWGLDYIARAYGTPCSAWSHSQATDWY